MNKIILILLTISFSVYADSKSEKKCKAIQEKDKGKCATEKVSKCVWSENKCKTNKAFLEDEETLSVDNDKCTTATEKDQCTKEKVSLCIWSDEIAKCVLNEDEKGKSLNLPHSGNGNKPKLPVKDK